jgi:hypothetical protein
MWVGVASLFVCVCLGEFRCVLKGRWGCAFNGVGEFQGLAAEGKSGSGAQAGEVEV